MYLKQLEMVGFKSFAHPIKLEFGPGIMAIVGPNGCGKSNIADAVRWVLGEQNARALRGAKMEDCIFNGTESHPALGMAEVSLTLAECESVLGLDYHEVTVTRRVFRSGESEYLINKTPCRLKDIQRLFMDTGIGTNSYSLMEQGRIDRVLSSRPEDRRSVFEEASGITKFKTDKKEALRKLEHTEANLLRLGDLIREIKRQIISLQRQAGKARRYQALQRQVRAVELYLARQRLIAFDDQIRTLDLRRASLREREEAEEAALRDSEQRLDAARVEMESFERQLETLRERVVCARAEKDHAHDSIAVNEERIRELRGIAARDRNEAESFHAQAEALRRMVETDDGAMEAAVAARAASEIRWKETSARMKDVEQRIESAQRRVQDLRDEMLSLEQCISRRQAELSDIEARVRTALIRREKLNAEKADLQRAQEQLEGREAGLARRINALQAEAMAASERESAASEQKTAASQRADDLARRQADLRAEWSALVARIEMLERQEKKAEGYSEGARWLLGAGSPAEGSLLGALAARLQVETEYRIAVEAALRPWLDGLLVSDTKAVRDLLGALEEKRAGAVRLLPVKGPSVSAAEGPGELLLHHIQTDEEIRPLLSRLLSGVRVVASAAEIPAELPPGITLITRGGAVYRGDGPAEFWMAENGAPHPLERHHLLSEWQGRRECLDQEISVCERELQKGRAEEAVASEKVAQARNTTAEVRRRLALAEGERHALEQEAQKLKQRFDTVVFEIEALGRDETTDDDLRAQIQNDIEDARRRIEALRMEQREAAETLREMEHERSRALSAATDARMEWNDRRAAVEQLTQRRESQRQRIEELEAAARQRAAAAEVHDRRVAELEASIAEVRERMSGYEDNVARAEADLENARQNRESRMTAMAAMEHAARQQRVALDATRRERNQLDVEYAEVTTRRQALIERVGADHRVSVEDIARAEEPQWEEFGGMPPDREARDALAAELRAKLESLGAVNLIAIEEYENLEKRHAFLTQQQDDLLKAKQQLLDMIRRINQTTTAMFRETFDKVNENFRIMFEKLFGGGSAKLVLVDEEDVLECGIEIIARPPGKKLQSVSLLSGGERTMTAVALLFALYLVKPSPFCLLDELDAALDDANIGRFVRVVQDFVGQSQFIIITHNRQTISAANRLFGVTMEKQGISKIVSVRFNAEGRPETWVADGTPRESQAAPA